MLNVGLGLALEHGQPEQPASEPLASGLLQPGPGAGLLQPFGLAVAVPEP